MIAPKEPMTRKEALAIVIDRTRLLVGGVERGQLDDALAVLTEICAELEKVKAALARYAKYDQLIGAVEKHYEHWLTEKLVIDGEINKVRAALKARQP